MRILGALATMLTLVLLGVGPAAANAGIGPDQHFLGVVNGSRDMPVVVDTVCPGPLSPGRLGPVAGGQSFEVIKVRAGGGYTGPLGQLHAWFVPNGRVNGPLAVTFANYGTPVAIPSGVRVPCAGSGRVEFSPCPYLAPCVAGWQPNYVKVSFVDIAARPS
jgi:hypothetical protein